MQCDRSQQKKEKRERDTGRDLGSEEPRSISNQDNCHVPDAGFSLPFFGSAASYSDSSSEEITFLAERLIVPQFTKF